jgi:hypothetical protein
MSSIRRMPTPRAYATLAVVLFAALSIPSAGLDAQETDTKWLPWVGCWNAVAEAAPMLCFVPKNGEEGIELVTVVDGEISSRETILSDGRDQPVDREGCKGWERTEFSKDSRRVYFQSELVCGEDVATNSTGLMAMQTPFEWVDIKSVEVDGASAPFVMRYVLAPKAVAESAGLQEVGAGLERRIQTARNRAAQRITIDDVLEVIPRMDTEAVEAWIAETNQEFDVNAKSLVRMADAGVPETVIDLIVAISFPREFAIDRGPNGRGAEGLLGDDESFDRSRYGAAGTYYGRYYDDPFFLGRYYSPYYGNRYSSFGYGSLYGYGGFGVYSPTVVVVDRRNDGDDNVVANRGGGRVINGRGYSSGSRRGSRASSGGSRSGSSASGSSARRGSAGSSSSSSGRKAKRRGGGF